MYELYIEGFRVDIDQKISVQLSFAIDDVSNYGSRETSFSKTIVLPGTAYNNKIFGFIYELGSNNPIIDGGTNIGAVFNVAQTSRAELRLNGLLVLKGVFRMLNIVNDGGQIEYEGSIFGELAGFISKIGNRKLEELDFNEYNHKYTRNAIVNSWENAIVKDVVGDFINIAGLFIFYIEIKQTLDLKITVGDTIIITNAFNTANNQTYEVTSYSYDSFNNMARIGVDLSVFRSIDDTFTIQYSIGDQFGKGFYYPLINYGTYTTNGVDYDYRTFRPALFVKEYIDKIFAAAGYSYESEFINSEFFKKLIVPNNSQQLQSLFSELLNVASGKIEISAILFGDKKIPFIIENIKKEFTGNGNPEYTYTGPSRRVKVSYHFFYLIGKYLTIGKVGNFEIQFRLNGAVLRKHYFEETRNGIGQTGTITSEFFINISNTDKFDVRVTFLNSHPDSFVNFRYLTIDSEVPVLTEPDIDDDIIINHGIPKNILQKDFFTWILKMFNLYVTEDKLKDRHLIIEPYVDYYDNDNVIDWTYKIARDKPWQIKPMGMLNGRFFEYRYKPDNDFYNEGYNKKFNQPYGTMLHDTEFEFAKTKQTLEIGFSPTPLLKYDDTDKVVSAIFKKKPGTNVGDEELIDSNIRILMVKKIDEVDPWYIKDGSTNLGGSLTAYGYAGHFDDPVNPTKDINFGAADEIYFSPNTYPSNNLFNDYWSEYIGEIANKDSKLMSCHVYLKALDIAQLDFSKPVMIDGVQFRINKVEDYDYVNNDLVKVELLKVIHVKTANTLPPCANDWTLENYGGTTLRDGTPIPEVTNNAAWAALTTPAWCYYNNNPANGAIYGKLYNWYAVSHPLFAPEGYRVPTEEDWDNLINCLGGFEVAGGKMKSTSDLWTAPNTGATNESGFNVLPGGLKKNNGVFQSINTGSYFWNKNGINDNEAFGYYLRNEFDAIFKENIDKKYGFSVRLIKE